jgi:hypothetical protein
MRALTVDFAIFEDAPCITCNRCKSIWDLEVSGGKALARKRNNAESIRVERSSHEDEDGGTLRLRPCGPTLRARSIGRSGLLIRPQPKNAPAFSAYPEHPKLTLFVFRHSAI